MDGNKALHPRDAVPQPISHRVREWNPSGKVQSLSRVLSRIQISIASEDAFPQPIYHWVPPCSDGAKVPARPTEHSRSQSSIASTGGVPQPMYHRVPRCILGSHLRVFNIFRKPSVEKCKQNDIFQFIFFIFVWIDFLQKALSNLPR